MKKKDDLLNLMGGNNMKKTAELGIEFFKGMGKLLSKNEVEIDDNGTKKVVTAKNIILNMGCESSPLPGNAIPIDKKRVITSD